MSKIIVSCIVLAILACAFTGVGQAKIVSISACSHVLALNDDGTVYAWGSNWFGQVGAGNFSYWQGSGNVGNPRTFEDPQKVSIDNVTAISAYGDMSLALKNDGTVWAWGYGDHGQLGYGGIDRQITPIQVKNLTNVTAIAAGSGTCYALKDDGTVYAWGNNNHDDVGDGTTENRLTPVQVKGLTNIRTLGEHGNYAIKDDGTVYAWGNNVYSIDLNTNTTTYGALGNSSSLSIIWPPFRVEGVDNVKQITGTNPTLYVKNDGTVRAWGSNFYGGLGDGTATDSTRSEAIRTPSVQTKISDVKQLSSSNLHTIALKNDGTLWVWGKYIDSTASSIGSGTPVKVSGPDHVVQVCAGIMCDFALTNDGSIWGWGRGENGELRKNKVLPSPNLIWKGPDQNNPNDTSTPGSTNTPAHPSPGFSFSTIIVLGCLFITARIISRHSGNGR
jgi:alpha-tubulin suppressor-like RCC1 family protein